MMNIPTTVNDIAIALKETPNLGLGVHLVLTMGKPLSKPEVVPSIVDENGNHLKYNPFLANVPSLNMDEVKAEWRLQIERFVKAAGRKPTHLDSHHHSSYWSPALFRGMLELTKEYDCPIRFPFTEKGMNELTPTREDMPALMKEFSPKHPDRFISNFYDDGATQDELIRLIKETPEGTTEIMCHPGYVDEAFAKESVYNFQRERELKILTDPATKQAIQANGIELITFADL
jgi:predicted glycoside hydrolase/deacetylase ChbG (UPF0249 family)